MTGISAVGVYDDLTACQTAVAVRSADNETAGGIDEIFGILIYHVSRNDGVKYIFFDVLVDLLLGHISGMLGGKNNRIKANRLAVFIIFYRNLSLAVRTKVRQGAVLADLRQSAGQLVCQVDGIRHVAVGLVCRKTEHHTLVACADGCDLSVAHLVFLSLKSLINAHGDVCGLLVQGNHNCAGISVDAHVVAGVADLSDRISDDLLEIYLGLAGDLTHDNNHACGGAGLASHTAHGILGHQGVENGIRNLVADFIGMSLGNRFRCKKQFFHIVNNPPEKNKARTKRTVKKYNPLIVRCYSLRLAPSSSGVAAISQIPGLHCSE